VNYTDLKNIHRLSISTVSRGFGVIAPFVRTGLILKIQLKAYANNFTQTDIDLAACSMLDLVFFLRCFVEVAANSKSINASEMSKVKTYTATRHFEVVTVLEDQTMCTRYFCKGDVITAKQYKQLPDKYKSFFDETIKHT
jgi:hypothetical protein